ncbi:MAG: relaxase/mobilization nuclease domain-containing protein, partial [Clostridia bacterium]|nr:relaxase/mobilization nuclease domain-containing protein [Clostridia bacterium]
MATVKEIEQPIKSQQYVKNSIEYILSPENKDGDEKCFKSTGLNCDGNANSIALQFSLIRMQYSKDNKNLAHHYVQSFSPNEKVTPELAHQIAVELMQKVAPNFQVIISTHIDKDHLHNHIIINSVNMETGMKWKADLNTRLNMRDESDSLCRKYGLSTIEKKSGLRGIDQTTQKLAEKGRSWKVELCKALDEVTSLCNRKDNFIHYMEVKGFKITRYGEKDITFQKIGETKKIRASTLAKQFGEVYTKENIEKKMSIYRLPKLSERSPSPKKKNVKSPFISEFEKFEKDYFSKNPPLAKIVETQKFQNQIQSSSRPLMTLMSIIFNLFFRRKRRKSLDGNYRKLQKHGAYQTTYKKYVPSLEEQVRRIERLQRTAGNIPYHQLISSQGENYKVAIPLSSVPKLYAYNFFFSARLFKDKAMVTIKEKDKYLLQMA